MKWANTAWASARPAPHANTEVRAASSLMMIMMIQWARMLSMLREQTGRAAVEGETGRRYVSSRGTAVPLTSKLTRLDSTTGIPTSCPPGDDSGVQSNTEPGIGALRGHIGYKV